MWHSTGNDLRSSLVLVQLCVLYLVFSEETLCSQLVFATVISVHQTDRLTESGLQLRAVQQQLDHSQTIFINMIRMKAQFGHSDMK